MSADARSALEAAVREHGGARQAALELGVSHTYVYGVLAGTTKPGRKLTRALNVPDPANEAAEWKWRRARDRILLTLRMARHPICIGCLAIRCNVLDVTAKRVLHELEAEGLARRAGKGGRRWASTET